MSGFLDSILRERKNISTYVEPYAGGAGAAINLLLNERVDAIVINDYDPAVYWFWYYLVRQPEKFIEMISSTPITIEEWHKQHDIYLKKDLRSKFKLAFSFFFLNRCNRSGIVKGGVIGGKSQSGKYKLDARFKKDKLIEKIERLSKFSDRIDLRNGDGADIVSEYNNKSDVLLYLDPPYVDKGASLYLNAFSYDDHQKLARIMMGEESPKNWIITYDCSQLILSDELYGKGNVFRYSLRYSAQEKRRECEYLICSDSLVDIVSRQAEPTA